MLDSADDTIRLVQGSDLDCVRSGLASAVACIDSAGGYVMAAEKRKNGRKKNRAELEGRSRVSTVDV